MNDNMRIVPMQLHPNSRSQVERRLHQQQMTEQLTPALLPPRKRRPGEQRDTRLRQLEKDIQRGQIKCVMHIVEVLCGRIDRGEHIESVTQFPRLLDDLLRAYASNPTPTDMMAISQRLAKEFGEACGAGMEYLHRKDDGSRRRFAREVSEARDIADMAARALHLSREEAAA